MIDVAILLAAAFGLPSDTGKSVAKLFRPRGIARGQALFGQGDLCSRCWLIVDGTVALRAILQDGQQIQLTSYGPGELAGAFPAPRLQEAQLIADMHIEALEAEAVALARFAANEPGLGAGLASLLARQHDRLLARIANQISLSAVARVYAELLALADADGVIAPAPVLAALAVRVNTTRETASRAVAAAERRGLLQRHAGGLRIVSRARLEALQG